MCNNYSTLFLAEWYAIIQYSKIVKVGTNDIISRLQSPPVVKGCRRCQLPNLSSRIGSMMAGFAYRHHRVRNPKGITQTILIKRAKQRNSKTPDIISFTPSECPQSSLHYPAGVRVAHIRGLEALAAWYVLCTYCIQDGGVSIPTSSPPYTKGVPKNIQKGLSQITKQ